MKKVITIILCLLCAISASALSYASPYKGAGRNGYIYTTSSARSKAIGGSGSMAQAPVASMGSTSSVGSRGISYGGTVAAIPQVQGISTSASGIRGGITAEDTYARSCGPRKIEVIPGKPEHCHCEDDGTGHCIHCGAELDEFDGGCSNNPCWCPIDFNGAVALFMAILAGAYAIYRVRTRQETIEAV